MTITLPEPPPSHVWIHGPAWLFASYHWTLVLAVGLLLLLFGVLMHRSEPSYASGLLIVLSSAPILIGLIAVFGSVWFDHHPSASTANQTWSRTRDENHDFKVEYSRVANTFKPPPRDENADITYANSVITKHTGMTVLHPYDMPTIVKTSTDQANHDAASKGSPFLVNGQVYTCAFLADVLNRDKNTGLSYAHIPSATCVQGSKSIMITIK